MHLTIDGFGGNPEKLADQELVRGLLDRYPERIGMTKIAPPHVQEYVGEKPEDWGVSGFVLIAESHIAIHTFPDRGYVWVDIFSCKGFDQAKSLRTVADAFDMPLGRVTGLERGLEYPHAIDEAVPIADLERQLVGEQLVPAAAHEAG